MRIAVNGTRLWFDVDGPALVPDGRGMRQRPTMVVVHGGPSSFDHSYFKPHFAPLTGVTQVVYLDLRGLGRSARHDPADWSFELCADDLRAFCDAVGIVRPVVLGHSMGGFIAMLYAARHPAHPGALVLLSTMARFDLKRLVDAFRKVAGDDVAELARRDFGGESISDEESDRVFAAFGPRTPDDDEMARAIGNPDLGGPGMNLVRTFDVVAKLPRITCPTLICTGALDPVTPPAAAREIADALPGATLEVLDGAGHFPWLDRPGNLLGIITTFAARAAARESARASDGGGVRH